MCYLCLNKQTIKAMKTIILKSEKNAKVYEIRSSVNQGVYKENELIRIVKTDNINTILNETQYKCFATEVK